MRPHGSTKPPKPPPPSPSALYSVAKASRRSPLSPTPAGKPSGIRARAGAVVDLVWFGLVWCAALTSCQADRQGPVRSRWICVRLLINERNPRLVRDVQSLCSAPVAAARCGRHLQVGLEQNPLLVSLQSVPSVAASKQVCFARTPTFIISGRVSRKLDEASRADARKGSPRLLELARLHPFDRLA